MEAFDQALVHFKEVTGFVNNQRSDEDDQMVPGPSSSQVKDNKRWTIFEITLLDLTFETFGSSANFNSIGIFGFYKTFFSFQNQNIFLTIIRTLR